MTLYDFNKLSKVEQYSIAFNKASHIKSIKGERLSFILYGLDKFYIELVYESFNNTVVDIRTFKEGPLLNKYFPSSINAYFSKK